MFIHCICVSMKNNCIIFYLQQNSNSLKHDLLYKTLKKQIFIKFNILLRLIVKVFLLLKIQMRINKFSQTILFLELSRIQHLKFTVQTCTVMRHLCTVKEKEYDYSVESEELGCPRFVLYVKLEVTLGMNFVSKRNSYVNFLKFCKFFSSKYVSFKKYKIQVTYFYPSIFFIILLGVIISFILRWLIISVL